MSLALKTILRLNKLTKENEVVWEEYTNELIDSGAFITTIKKRRFLCYKQELSYWEQSIKLNLIDDDDNVLEEFVDISALNDLYDTILHFNTKRSEIDIKISEVSDEVDEIGNWRIQLDIKTTKSKLKEFERIFRESVNNMNK